MNGPEAPESDADEIPRRTIAILRSGLPTAFYALTIALGVTGLAGLAAAAVLLDGPSGAAVALVVAFAGLGSVVIHGVVIAVCARTLETRVPSITDALDFVRPLSHGAAGALAGVFVGSTLLVIVAAAALGALVPDGATEQGVLLGVGGLFGAWILGASLLRFASATVPEGVRRPRTGSRWGLAPVVGLITPMIAGAFFGPSVLSDGTLRAFGGGWVLVHHVVAALLVSASPILSCALAVAIASRPREDP